VYVATVALGAAPQQTLAALREAEAYSGPSLILAYSQCIAHGIDMRLGMQQQQLAVASGHWPLIRFNPALRAVGANPFQLDSPRPTIRLQDFTHNEMRYKSLAAVRPKEAAALAEMAQAVATERYRGYEELARRDGSRFHPAAEAVDPELQVDLPDGGARRADHEADTFRIT
jgi:pyruvate-ferredoxin/flavodoxin oxidoreductase